ncbi:hypothetical protein [Myxosarcina sp. GI1(2024)]
MSNQPVNKDRFTSLADELEFEDLEFLSDRQAELVSGGVGHIPVVPVPVPIPIIKFPDLDKKSKKPEKRKTVVKKRQTKVKSKKKTHAKKRH